MFISSTPVGGLFWFLATVASVRCKGADLAKLAVTTASASLVLLDAASMVLDGPEIMLKGKGNLVADGNIADEGEGCCAFRLKMSGKRLSSGDLGMRASADVDGGAYEWCDFWKKSCKRCGCDDSHFGSAAASRNRKENPNAAVLRPIEFVAIGIGIRSRTLVAVWTLRCMS